MALAAIAPLILQLLVKSKLLPKYTKLSVSLFFVILAWEIVGLTFNYWVFPGKDYFAVVTFFGQSFPAEEIIF